MIVQEKQRAIQMRRNAELIGAIPEVLGEGRNQALGQWIATWDCLALLKGALTAIIGSYPAAGGGALRQ